MPALKPTDYTAEIVFLGRVEDREAGLQSVPVPQARLGWAGLEGEAHGGVTRPACSRTSAQHEPGTEIRNVRQLSILSMEEIAATARDMGIDRFEPAWLGASMVIRGIPDFSHLPPSSRLQGPDGATLVVDMQNRPCVWPGKVIEAEAPGFGKKFKPAAEGRRGVTAWVEREGVIRRGDTLTLHIPDQRGWAHLDAARG